MAEIVGVIASCVALGQLVGYGQKFAKELRQFSRCSGSPTEQLQRCANQAAMFWGTIGTAELALDNHCDQHRDSPVLKYVSSMRIFEQFEMDAKFVKRDLSDAIERLRSLTRSRLTIVRFIKWLQYKDSVLVPFPQMELLQNCFQMVATAVNLEACSLTRKNLLPDAIEQEKKLQKEK